jgi:citrate lyase subunit beta/citryl-CoA lyase
MVDAPVVKRAARILKTAIAFGMIDYELTDEVIHGHE